MKNVFPEYPTFSDAEGNASACPAKRLQYDGEKWNSERKSQRRIPMQEKQELDIHTQRKCVA